MDGLLILAIETATGCGSVSLTRGGDRIVRVLAECTFAARDNPFAEIVGLG